ncbi:MAG: HIT family protein [Tannerella sp.]|jgi:histidine triad (HIT) family protein|nr:HIT family protein [Tannerella sp.]
MTSIFSKIIRGEISGYKIAENDDFFAFLDIRPIAKGHTLVVPKKETDYIFDIDDNELGRMMIFAKKIAIAIKEAIPCTRVGVAVMGLEVPHAHIHLIPINKEADMYFCNPKLNLTPEEFETIAQNIRLTVNDEQ